MVSYMDGETLRDLLCGPHKSKVQVVDVRDEDFFDYVPGAVNVPSEQWDDPTTVEAIYTHCKCKGVTRVVFHCMKSQQRGPFCARLFYDHAAEQGEEMPEVFVLKNGFFRWKQDYQEVDGLVIKGTEGILTLNRST